MYYTRQQNSFVGPEGDPTLYLEKKLSRFVKNTKNNITQKNNKHLGLEKV